MPKVFDIFSQFFWLFCIVSTVANGLLWRRRNKKLLADHPELAGAFARMLKGWLLWGNIPWIVMGLGCTIGHLTVLDYIQPRNGHPFVLAWFITEFLLWSLGFWWIILKNGAKRLAQFPGLLSLSANPKLIKLECCLGIVVGIIGTVLMFMRGSPLPYWQSLGLGYTRVFVIYDGYWRVAAEGLLFLAVGIAVLIVSIYWLRRLHLPKWWNRKEAVAPGFMLFWSVLWLTGVIIGFGLNMTHQTKLLNIYRDGQAQVVEGQVHVLRQQPASGHASGDLIEVGGRQFTIDYFVVAAAYDRTIAYGGVLKEGTFVRLWYHDGDILAIDVQQ